MERLSGTTNPIETTPARPDDLFSTKAGLSGLRVRSPSDSTTATDSTFVSSPCANGWTTLSCACSGTTVRSPARPCTSIRIEITVQVNNDGDVEATVHWHGLRLENRYDGVPHETQAPIPIGGSFTYKVQFPDAGFYWYHPHIREDFGLEMGLYGTIIVEPADPSYWPVADRQLSITLDDLLVEDGHIAPFHRSGPNHTRWDGSAT